VLRTCFAYARESGFSAMILLYEDGMREPDEIPGLLSPILGGKSDAAVASWLAENHVKAAKGRRVSPRGTVDSRVGMIALSAGAVTALDTGNLRSTLESGVLALLASSGLRVAEVPIITEAKEGAGESSNPLVGVYNFGVRFIARIFYTHPLVLFGLSGILLIGIAVFLWSRSITIEALLMSLTFGSTFASGILLVLGILLCISGLILNLIRTLEKAKETKRSEGANCR
jgi:hypothetical protein